MKIQQLKLQCFRGFSPFFEIAFDPRLTVFVGENGMGKSSLLDSLAILLSRLASRISTKTKTGRRFTGSDIANGFDVVTGKIDVQVDGIQYSWLAGKHRVSPGTPSSSFELIELIKRIRIKAHEDDTFSLPLTVLYSVNRQVDDVQLPAKKGHVFDRYAAIDPSLRGTSNFADFFTWYRNREDIENELFRDQAKLSEGTKLDERISPDPQLQAIRNALEIMMPGYCDLRVKRKPSLRMVVSKHGHEFSIQQLSDGEKCLLALVADMARRLAIANPGVQNPLHAEGVFLIDEVELHLHPAWQRMVLPRLLETFPNSQFIVTTHSPQVLGEVHAENIFRLFQNEQGHVVWEKPQRSKGLDSSEVLTEIMQAPAQNVATRKKLNTLYELILEGDIEQAQAEIAEMERELGDIPDLHKAKTMIDLH